ncbi:MAG: EAL domain-containing protein [Spirulinaceae cyanobacterium RM2_2_10]|nr:EAL domain-containing protein [Spirulinaceae cyanobacterium RM2_2_10]
MAQIDAVFRDTGLAYHSLRFEITESVLMENADAVTKLLVALRDRQIRIGIDDFGTGYSSLSYLHRLPASTLKIDRAFVARINPDGSNAEIVRAIVTLAHALDMDVVAEGIETPAQLQHLHQLGCEYGQGYFWANRCRPLLPKRC